MSDRDPRRKSFEERIGNLLFDLLCEGLLNIEVDDRGEFYFSLTDDWCDGFDNLCPGVGRLR